MTERNQEDIPNHLVDQLRVLLKLHRGEDLPDNVVTEFWKLQGLFSRIGANVGGHPLALMCYQLGYADGISLDRPAKTIREQWRTNEIGADTPVIVKWRKKDCEGVLKNVTANGMIVQLDGDDGERTVKDETVSLPELVPA